MGITRRRAAAGMAIGLLTRGIGSSAPASPRVKVSRLPKGGIQPQAMVDDRGALHVVYYSGDARGGDLHYIRSTDQGTTWTPGIAVNEPGSAIAAGTIRGAQVSLGRQGRVQVAWNGSAKTRIHGPVNPDSGKPGAPMLHTRLNDAGSAFESARNLMTGSFGLDGGGSVAADRAGNVYVAWHGIGLQEANGELEGEARRRVWIARSHDDGKSFTPEEKAWEEPTGACACCGMKAFAGRQGNVMALYRSARASVQRDIYLLHSADGGKTFRGKLLHEWRINACPMSSMDIAESDGRVVAAWETGGQVYWAFVTGLPGDRKPEPVAAPGEAKGRKHPRLAINQRGQLLLVWTEGTGWQRGGALAWQLYEPSGRTTGVKGMLPGIATWSFAAPVADPDGQFTILV